MSEAQELQIQPQAEVQAQTQTQAQLHPNRSAPSVIANETTSSSRSSRSSSSSSGGGGGGSTSSINSYTSNSTNSHGSLPTLVSSNLPDPSILDRKTSSQPSSQAPAEGETHTQYSTTTYDLVDQAQVKTPQVLEYQQGKPTPDEANSGTNPEQAILHGAIKAARGQEAEKALYDIAPANGHQPVLTTIASSSPDPRPTSTSSSPLTAATTRPTTTSAEASLPTVTTAPLPTTTTTISPLASTYISTSGPLLYHDRPSEAADQRQLRTRATPTPQSPSAAMSHPPQHPGHPRPPVGFPSPTYASQGIYGYGSPTGPPGDLYRGPSSGQQPMSLPSMRTFDPVQQQQAQQAPMAQQMMQVQANMPSYYTHSVPLAGNPYSLPPDAMASRYALPPNDARFLGNPRNKKEIKRRTKTGCLTCRKRRIKCDEQHPVCKNCQKSKRECMGYDPIFKQQQQHPTTIQPAPNSVGHHPAPPSSLPSNGSSLPPPSSTSGPSGPTSYGSLPSVLPSSYNSGASSSSNTPGNAYEPSHSAPPPSVKHEHFEYGQAIDPALESVGAAPPSTSTTQLPPVQSVTPIASPLPQRLLSSTLHLRGGGRCSPHPASQSVPPFLDWAPAYSVHSAKKMRVDELVGWGRPPPPPRSKSFLDQVKMDEIRGLFEEIYAPGLERFFESKWFVDEASSHSLALHNPTMETIAGFLSVVAKADESSQTAMTESAHLELRVVWDFACLTRLSEPRTNPPSVVPPSNDPSEVRNRVFVFDALLSGTILSENPLVRPPPTGDYQRVRELDFWYHLGEFCRVEPLGYPPNPVIVSQRDQILDRIRSLLDARENRDLLYSIAVMRALSPEFPVDSQSTLPQHLNESDPRSKLAVARQFVQDEAKVTGGTTNIVRRFAEMAVVAFITPGANVTGRV